MYISPIIFNDIACEDGINARVLHRPVGLLVTFWPDRTVQKCGDDLHAKLIGAIARSLGQRIATP